MTAPRGDADHIKVKSPMMLTQCYVAKMNSILFVLHWRDKTIKILTGLELG